MRRGGMLVLALVMVLSVLSVLPAAAVSPTADNVVWEEAEAELVVENYFKKAGDGMWVIHFEEAPVATYDGSIDGYAPTATAETGAVQLNAASAAAVSYKGLLEQRQARYLTSIERTLDRSLNVVHEYFYAANGVAANMTWEEAARVAKMDGVKDVLKDTRHHLDTDNGPAWIGAPSAWSGSTASAVATEGEGVIVGVLDTGINPSNPSFADIGPIDAYDHTNPWGAGVYVGVCDSTDPSYDPTFPCNDKLIGAWSLVPASPFGGIDDDGHGSHTASTAAGNYVDAAVVGPTITENRDISGVAPHANIVAYDVCDGDGCNGTAILAGIDQAIADGVDVINYSIGSETPSDPWQSSDDLGFLAARAAGIFVAHSAGNEGPGYATVGSPMAPWMTHVAASTHDRKYVNAVINMTGGDTAPPTDLYGLGFTSSLGQYDIVYAGDYPSGETANPELCGVGALGDFNTPWDDPSTFTDKIVVCDRGTFGRVEKGANVLASGAAGFILADNGGGLSGDAHDLPAVHISQADGTTLKTWLASGTGHMGEILGATLDIDNANGDIIAGFSSRGPNRSADFIAPSIAAPGVDIIAAHGQGDPVGGVWDFVSGTSMASPHVAGVAALFKNLQPTWTPAELQSALMLTANSTMLKEDGVTAADPFDMGSGRVDIVAADNTALVMNETTSNYEDADPALGGDVADLNIASMSQDQCVLTCSWDRTFRSVAGTDAVNFTIADSAEGGVVLSASPDNFSLDDGESITVTFTADVSAAAADEYHFGWFTISNDNGNSTAALPVAVQPTTGSLPDLVDITTARNHGSWLVRDLEALEITDFHAEVVGLVKGDKTSISLEEDPTSLDIYDDPSQNHVDIVNVPSGSVALIAQIVATDSPDLDLFVGFDANTDGIPQEGEEVCRSASGTAFEECSVDPDGDFGDYWIMVQNWADPASGAIHDVTYVTAVVDDSDEGNMSVEGPATQPELDPFDIQVLFDLPGAMEGDYYYGGISLGTSPGNAGNLGSFPVELTRVADDVTKTASVATAKPGDTVTYEITINPNVTNQDLVYTITDTIPDGMTLVGGASGATVNGQDLEWTVEMDSPLLAEGFYEISYPSTNAACDTGFGGYVDLEGFGIFADPGITGDTQLFTAFGTANPVDFYGDTYTGGVSFSDDGFLMFDTAGYSGDPWITQDLPDPTAPNGVLTMLWQDFQFVYEASGAYGQSGVSLATAGPDTRLIEWDNVRFYQDTGIPDTPVLDMEAVIYSTPDPVFPEIVIAFSGVDSTNIDWGLNNFQDYSFGVENNDGSAGLSEVFGDPTALLAEGQVCFDWTGPVFDPVVLTYDVTVDADAADGIATNAVESITDNYNDQAVATSVDVDIVNYANLQGDARAVLMEVSDIIGDWLDGASGLDARALVAARSFVNAALSNFLWVDENTLTPVGESWAVRYMELAIAALNGVSTDASFDADAEALAMSIQNVIDDTTAPVSAPDTNPRGTAPSPSPEPSPTPTPTPGNPRGTAPAPTPTPTDPAVTPSVTVTPDRIVTVVRTSNSLYFRAI